jgi:hypothetical protein
MAPRNRRYTGGTLPFELAIFAAAEHTAAIVEYGMRRIPAPSGDVPETV